MNIPIIKNGDSFALLKPSGTVLSLKAGDLIKAEVLDVPELGKLTVRIIPVVGKSAVVTVQSKLHFVEGDMIHLKVAGGEAEVRLQFMGMEKTAGARPEKIAQDLPALMKGILTQLSDAKLMSREISMFRDLFRSIPEGLKSSHPEFLLLEKIMPEIERLTGALLKSSVEDSGVLFETKLRLASRDLPWQSTGSQQKVFSPEQDLKGLLFRVREALNDEKISGLLKQEGVNVADLRELSDKFLKNIEFFQLSSRMNDILYTYLPVLWHEMRDGELSFKRRETEGNSSHTCDINLDLEPSGKISASVTLHEGGFYISLRTDNPLTKTLIENGRHVLEKKFSDSGMRIIAMNVTEKDGISFGPDSRAGVNVKA